MAQHRHKRETPATPRPKSIPRSVQVAAPLAVVATLSAVTMGILAAEPATSGEDLLASSSSTSQSISGAVSNSTALSRRGETTVSRSQIRTAARAEAAAREDLTIDRQARRLAKRLDAALWTTEALNLWDGPGEKAEKLGVIDPLEQVAVTGRQQAGRTQVVIDGQSRWVTSDYLVQEKPEPEPEGPSLGGTCSNGVSIDAGRASLYDIFNAVCSNWPEITSYGTWRSDGEHGQGRAMDIMVSGATGWEVANFIRENYASLGVEYVIHARNIWSVDRAGEGWRGMADRGSITANHLDHVHVTVY